MTAPPLFVLFAALLPIPERLLRCSKDNSRTSNSFPSAWSATLSALQSALQSLSFCAPRGVWQALPELGAGGSANDPEATAASLLAASTCHQSFCF